MACEQVADELQAALGELLPQRRFETLRTQLARWDELEDGARAELCLSLGWRRAMFLDHAWFVEQLDPRVLPITPDFPEWSKNQTTAIRGWVESVQQTMDDAAWQEVLSDADLVTKLDLSGFGHRGDWVHRDAVDWTPPRGTVNTQVLARAARLIPMLHLVRAHHRTGEGRYLDTAHRLLADLTWEIPGNVVRAWVTIRTHWGIDALDVAIRTRHLMEIVALTSAADGWGEDAARLAWKNLYWCGARGHEFFHVKNHNIAFYEAAEQARLGFYFACFRDAADWRDSAQRRLAGSLDGSVMADGSNIEGALGYHHQYINGPLEVCRAATDTGLPLLPELERKVSERVRLMLNFWARVVTPTRQIPPLGDAWPHSIGSTLRQWAPLVNAEVARRVADVDDPSAWPVETSCYLPVQRYAVMRSGWDADALWCGFTLRGFHEGHDHRDLLHVEVQAGNRRLLLDSGVIDYEANRERSRATAAHNTLVVDGLNQLPGAATGVRWHSTSQFDWCQGAAAAFPGVVHERAVCFIKPDVLIIFDRVRLLETPTTPRRFEIFFHLPADARVQTDGLTLRTVDNGTWNVRLDFVADPCWSLQLTEGFIATSYMHWTPAPVAVLRSQTDMAFTVATVVRTCPPGREVDGVVRPVQVQWRNAGDGQDVGSDRATAISIATAHGSSTILWAELGLGVKTSAGWATDGDLLLVNERVGESPTVFARTASQVMRHGEAVRWHALHDTSDRLPGHE